MSVLETMAKRVRALEQRQDTLETEEAPENTSLVTRQYPNYIIPSGETLTIPTGVTLHTGGEVIGTTSGTLEEKEGGDGINVVRNGSFERFPRQLPVVQIVGVSVSGTSITGISASDLERIEPGMYVYVISTVFPSGETPDGTVLESVDLTSNTARMSEALSAGSSTFFDAAQMQKSGYDWQETFWFGEVEGPRYSFYRTTTTGVGVFPAAILSQRVSNTTGYLGVGNLIAATDCQHMLGSTVSLQAYVQRIDPVSGVGVVAGNIKIAILEWDGDADDRPLNIVSSWAATPTFVAGITLKGFASVVATVDWTLITLTNVPLSDTFSNLIVFVWRDEAMKQSGLGVSQCQLERGDTNTAYREYGA